MILRIREEQLADLEAATHARYCLEVRSLLRSVCPQLVARLDDATLFEQIKEGVRSAGRYGIRTPEGIVGYVGLSIAAGPGFNSDPKVRKFFELGGKAPDAKVRWMFKRVIETLRTVSETRSFDKKPR